MDELKSNVDFFDARNIQIQFVFDRFNFINSFIESFETRDGETRSRRSYDGLII